ncbi:MAG: hypothetical protein U1E05_09040 [Patescibacteria group bacterium]|nr:hypothetical protein [Patescibacteria group bacterium]
MIWNPRRRWQPLLTRATLCTLIAGLPPAIAGWAADTPEPAMEKLVLADGENGAKWNSAEATMEPDATHARSGKAMRFHVDVNHLTGEAAYPIGWPRTYTSVPAERQDWSKWDFLDFWVYSDTSRAELPNTPLGLIVRSPDRQQSFHAPLTELKKGAWTHFRFPVAKMPVPTQCTAVQFAIAEADYAHGDVVDFWLDDLALLRYAEPTLLGIRPQRQVIHADATTLRVEVELTGVDDGKTVEIAVALRRDGQTVASTTARLPSGIASVVLPLKATEPGPYEVEATVAGSPRTLGAAVRVITSPWEVKP